MVLAVQSMSLLALGILLLMSGLDMLSTVVFFLLPVAVMQLFTFIIVGNYALEPLDFLARTVTQVSDQPHNTTPPNLNGTRHERTGWKLMVDTIYQRAQTATSPPAETATSSISKAVLDGLPAGVIALNESRTVMYSNVLAPLGSDPAGKPRIQLEFEEGDALDDWLSHVETSQVKAEKTWSRVQTAAPGTEGRRVFDVAASYQKNGAGGVETLVVTYDQTAKYAVNEDAIDFMALAAHELRGPITVIRGYLDILKPELNQLTDDQKQLLDRLDVSASRLSGYVGNILNAAKFDRRHLKLHLREDRLTDIYGLVADDLALRASTQGRLLSVTFPDDLPTIAADRNSLSEVIVNLVDNGIKYSREGGQVNLSAAVDGDVVRVSVQDQGIGIPSSVVGNLFSKFYRSHRSKHAVSGTGLGLYISKAIVESHGGKMGVTSVEGEGSTFSFTVPVYSTVADKLLASDAENQGIIETSSGWIKNHSMYRG